MSDKFRSNAINHTAVLQRFNGKINPSMERYWWKIFVKVAWHLPPKLKKNTKKMVLLRQQN